MIFHSPFTGLFSPCYDRKVKKQLLLLSSVPLIVGGLTFLLLPIRYTTFIDFTCTPDPQIIDSCEATKTHEKNQSFIMKLIDNESTAYYFEPVDAADEFGAWRDYSSKDVYRNIWVSVGAVLAATVLVFYGHILQVLVKKKPIQRKQQ